jgi:zinc-ribbon domain
MRWESLVIGILILLFGIFLVSSQGVVAGVNLPGLIGLPCQGATNGTACPGFGGYSVGTVVCLFALGLIANGVRSPSMPRGLAGGGAPSLPPEITATLEAARRQMEVASQTMRPTPWDRGAVSGVLYCPSCGRSNAQDAQFCQRCGKTLPSVSVDTDRGPRPRAP